MIQLSPIEWIYLFSAGHGIFLISLLLLRIRSNKANIFLTLLIGFFSFYLFEQVVYMSGYIRQVPHLYFATLPLIFLFGPLFYHFVRTNLRPEQKLKLRHLLHLAPFLFELIILTPFYTLNATIKLRVYDSSLETSNSWEPNIFFFGFLIYILSSLLFFSSAWKLLSQSTWTNAKSKKKVQWLKRSSLLFIIYMLISISLSILLAFRPDLWPVALHFNLIGQVLIIHSLGYVCFLYPELIHVETSNGPKYQYSSLSSESLAELKTQLLELMNRQKPHLNQDLNQEQLAQELNISKNQLSQLISEGFDSNFYRLVNNYRVKQAQELIKSAKYAHAKIIHIALDSGFSNKSSFLRNFKEVTGLTPSEFKKNGSH